MKIEITAKSKLKRCPTDICYFQDKIYISTKGKRVFYSADFKTFKTILFTSQVNSLSTNSQVLFASQKNGAIFALNSAHKTIFKINAGDSQCIHLLCDMENDDIFVGLENKKICLFSSSGISKNNFYFNEGPLVDFDVSKEKLIAKCTQNDQNVNFSNKEKFTIKVADGFPEIVKFITSDLILIGSTTGILNCFSKITKKRISFLKLADQISSICPLTKTSFLVGIPNRIILVDFSNFNKMEIIDEIEVNGIPVAFCSENKEIFVAISRESRIGRWRKEKEGDNQVLRLKIE